MSTQIKPYLYVSQGAGVKMFTLWRDTQGGSQYVKPRYIKNLSTDKEKAMQMAQAYADKCGLDLYDDAVETLREIKRVHTWTPTKVRFGKNYGIELAECEPKFIVWVAKGCPLLDEYQTQKEGVDVWTNNYYGGEDFCEVAKDVAVELGLGVTEDYNGYRRFYTNDQYAKILAKRAEKEKETNGHFYENGQRLELELTLLKRFSFSTEYGEMNILTFKDSDSRIFKYKGSKSYYLLDEGKTIKLKATIKQGAYQGRLETYLQRLDIISKYINL